MLFIKNKISFYLFLFISALTYSQNSSNPSANHYHDLALSQLIENKLDEALNNIDKSIYINQHEASSYYIKGIIYERKGSYYVAIENFKKAITLEPSNSDFYIKTAYSFAKINRIEEACNYLQEACILGEPKACEGIRKLCNNNDQNVSKTTNENENFQNERFDINNSKPNTASNNNSGSSSEALSNTAIETTYAKDGFFETLLKGSDNISTKYTTKTIEDSHIKQSDGTWKPKYKTYSPNRDNDAIPGNKIDYDQNENNLLVFISIIVIIALLIILLLYITKGKANNKNDNINNLNKYVPQQKQVSNSLNSQLYFTKFKFTEGLWYKHQYNTIFITEETILINCLPIFSYNGLYYIQNVMQNKTFNLTRFIVRYENPEIGIEYTIDIEKNGKKVSVYKKDLVGIIFKV